MQEKEHVFQALGVSLTRLVTMGSISLGSRLVRVMRSAFSVLIRWNTNLM